MFKLMIYLRKKSSVQHYPVQSYYFSNQTELLDIFSQFPGEDFYFFDIFNENPEGCFTSHWICSYHPKHLKLGFLFSEETKFVFDTLLKYIPLENWGIILSNYWEPSPEMLNALKNAYGN